MLPADRKEAAANVTRAALLAGLIGAGTPLSVSADSATVNTVVLTAYSADAAMSELVRRVLSPLEAEHVGAVGPNYTVDLASERFVVRVPPRAPPGGFALLVFVPPWQDARVPRGWDAVLDRFSMLFISAARSGNDEDPLRRREPLAILAARNALERYPVNADRVYIAGFSGGSRVALRLALAYPDLFRGVVLNAGSDPIGTREIPLPPADLMLRFQRATRIIYLTGERDTENENGDLVSAKSLRRWCVGNVEAIVEPRLGHEVADALGLARALSALSAGTLAPSAKLEECRSAIASELEAKLAEAQAAMTSANRSAARELLRKIDRQFGGLAAPRSVEMFDALK